MILIIGCGFLGNYLIKHIREKSDEPILATAGNLDNLICYDNVEYLKCDVTDEEDLKNLRNKIAGNPVKVFYFAASHNIDYVYENPVDARKVNVDGLESFLSTITSIDSLFFASTDCVYGESRLPEEVFTEKTPVNPINEYGRQKLVAEELVLRHGFTVLRFSLLLGPSLTDKKNFYDKLCMDLLNSNEIEMIDGMKRQVISYADAARFMFELSNIDSEMLPDIINVCGDKFYSKYDIGCVLAEKNKLSTSLVKKISEEQGKSFFLDKRASCIHMDNSLLKSLLKIDQISWEEMIC